MKSESLEYIRQYQYGGNNLSNKLRNDVHSAITNALSTFPTTLYDQDVWYNTVTQHISGNDWTENEDSIKKEIDSYLEKIEIGIFEEQEKREQGKKQGKLFDISSLGLN